ncbi:MAG: hypothetical protein WD557_14210 [Dehalococcoidia bacterium]
MRPLPSTYLTLDGEVLGLSRLDPSQRALLAEASAAFQRNMPWSEFANHYVDGPGNPLLEVGFRVTRDVARHPLFVALRDMEDRLGIKQGRLKPRTGDDPAIDPFKDEFLTIAEAAELKGVSLRAVYKAVDRGALVTTDGRPTCVSVNSLHTWDVNAARRDAGSMAHVFDPICNTKHGKLFASFDDKTGELNGAYLRRPDGRRIGRTRPVHEFADVSRDEPLANEDRLRELADFLARTA